MKIICEDCGRLIRYEEPFNLNSTQEEQCPSGEDCPFKLRIARIMLEGGTIPNATFVGTSVRKEVIQSR